jgi:hypothetical protein
MDPEAPRTSEPPPPSNPPPGWYPSPSGSGQRWWDGVGWGPEAPLPQQPITAHPQPYVTLPPDEKSSAVALLLTILWPGGGHLYLGLTKKATPYVVANAIGFALGLTIILFPVTFIIWLVTLCMTVGSVSQDTDRVNEARREGRRIAG